MTAYQTTAEAVIDALVRNGVRDVFGIPGIHTVPLYRELGRSQLRHISPRHEQGAGFAADAYARSSGRPAVCLVVTGPGLTNISTAVAQAYSDSVPMLVVSTEIPVTNERNTGYLHEARNQRQFMLGILDQSTRVETPRQAAAAVDGAFRSFTFGRPRPIHVSIPVDKLDATGIRGTGDPPRARPRDPIASEPIEAASSLLRAASRPAVIVGGGAADAGPVVLELSHRLNAPVFSTVNGKGVMPDETPLGMGASIHFHAVHRYLETCDVVLAVGTELGQSDFWMGAPARLPGLIRVDLDPDQLDMNYPAQISLLGRSSEVLDLLLRRLPKVTSPHRALHLDALRSNIRTEASEEAGIWREVAVELRASLGESAIIAADNNQASLYGLYWFATAHPRSFLFPTGFATLGYGLPGAIGAKLANPDRDVVALLGDGGVMFTIAEVVTAVELKLPIPIVIVNNGGYGEIRREMVAQGVPPIGVDLVMPDFAALGQALGAYGSSISLSQLRRTLALALTKDKPTLIELRL